jgi:hypothetical protein
MKTRKTGIVRKLDEFGWLWAIRDQFDPEWQDALIKIRFATAADFDNDLFLLDFWVYGLDQKGIPTLRTGGQGWDERLGSRVLFTATSSIRTANYPAVIRERVEYVATKHHKTGLITVYRAPRGTTFWNFLQRYDPKKG